MAGVRDIIKAILVLLSLCVVAVLGVFGMAFIWVTMIACVVAGVIVLAAVWVGIGIHSFCEWVGDIRQARRAARLRVRL